MSFKKFKLSKNLILALIVLLSACQNQEDPNAFTLTGNLKNISDREVYLDRLFFEDKVPEVQDTAVLKNGQFTLSGKADETGLFRLRFQNSEKTYFFVNENAKLTVTGDFEIPDFRGFTFSGASNKMMQSLFLKLDAQQQEIMKATEQMEALKQQGTDSMLIVASAALETKAEALKNFLIKVIDSVPDPVVSMVALGFTSGINPSELKEPVLGLKKRFPKHRGVDGLISQFNKMLAAESNASEPSTGVLVGSQAPEFTLPDENGQLVSLSEFRGKYVLVDFWASWCGPCRGENPNVVKAHNTFKNKNFSILAVSLDEKKEDWLQAIKTDKLNWKQVSDLKGWNSPIVATYGFDGIPFNVLIDPNGKIIARELRDQALLDTLKKVLVP